MTCYGLTLVTIVAALLMRNCLPWRSPRTVAYSMRLLSFSKDREQLIITSAANPKLKLLKRLQEKKARDEEKLVLLEGHRVIIDAIRQGLRPHSILFTEKALLAPLGKELKIATASQADFSVDMVSDSLMTSICDTISNQGVAAAFYKPEQIVDLPIDSSLIIVCDEVRDPGNMGTIIRTCFGLNVSAILLSEGCCDPFSPKVLRSSMGIAVSPEMPIIQSSWNRIPDMLAQRGLQILLADAGGEPYDRVDLRRPTALVLGSEATGVGVGARGLKGALRVRIPMARGLESFNVAIASSIMLGEVARQRRLTD